jgi:hypothetical protein
MFISCVGAKYRPHGAPSMTQLTLGGSIGNTQVFSDFLVCVALYVVQNEDRPVAVGQQGDRPFDVDPTPGLAPNLLFQLGVGFNYLKAAASP